VLRPVALVASAALATLTVLTVLAGLAPARAASTSLTDVEPANGATVQQPPDAVVLTFSRPVDAASASATVTAPGAPAAAASVAVDGPQVVVDVPAAGEGEYVVGYSVRPSEDGGAALEGAVGFTVASDGAGPPAGGGAPWAAAAALAVAGLAAALFVTYRRVQASR
jgi:methionine-rich copper-binding protein CopC